MKPISRENCPVMRAVEAIGDPWTLLILREFFLSGSRRFSDIETQLDVSPNTLSARMKKLEDTGIVSREIYSQRPLRAEYQLTEKGRALAPVMNALYDWGQAHTSGGTGKRPAKK
ncbi:MAG: helix-turn-helix domain-containing protein [Pseudomonadota bacterium]